jgi:hypothetical protein
MFSFIMSTWFDVHTTAEGGQATRPVMVGDIPPSGYLTLTVKCIFSGTGNGTCFVNLSDGATFSAASGGGTSKNLNLIPGGAASVLQVIPPPEEDPPPPGG